MSDTKVLLTQLADLFEKMADEIQPVIILGDDDSIHLTDFQEGQVFAYKRMAKKLRTAVTR